MMSPPAYPRCDRWHAGWTCPVMSSGGIISYQMPISTRVSGARRGRGRAISVRPQSSRGSIRRVPGQEHMNVITEREVERSKKIITCTILVNDRRTYALFDTRARYSFVSELFMH